MGRIISTEGEEIIFTRFHSSSQNWHSTTRLQPLPHCSHLPTIVWNIKSELQLNLLLPSQMFLPSLRTQQQIPLKLKKLPFAWTIILQHNHSVFEQKSQTKEKKKQQPNHWRIAAWNFQWSLFPLLLRWRVRRCRMHCMSMQIKRLLPPLMSMQ